MIVSCMIVIARHSNVVLARLLLRAAGCRSTVTLGTLATLTVATTATTASTAAAAARAVAVLLGVGTLVLAWFTVAGFIDIDKAGVGPARTRRR